MAQSWIDNAAVGKPSLHPPVLFLPGWGFSGQVLDLSGRQYDWTRPSDPLDPATAQAEILAFCAQHHLETVQLVGWSMGAFLAVDCACAFPEKVARLTLVGMRAFWPPSEIATIRLGLAADPAAFLRDFYRKSLLGYKKEFLRFAAEQQDSLLESLDVQVLGRGLDYLSQWRLPAQLPPCRISCWHGRRDIIAPVAEAAQIPGVRTSIIEHGGHALFLDREFAPGE
ncbi:MAG: alpha/beta fold hydrolase [Desulfobulbia bacterium]